MQQFSVVFTHIVLFVFISLFFICVWSSISFFPWNSLVHTRCYGFGSVTFTCAANERLWADCCYIQEHEHVLTCGNVCKKKTNSKITTFDYLWLTLKLIVKKKS